MKKFFSKKPLNRQEYSYRIFFWCLVTAIAICLVLAAVTAFGQHPQKSRTKQSVYKVMAENLQMNRIKNIETESIDSVKAFVIREIDCSKGNINFYLTFKHK
jgi:hypothetical protein